MRYQIFVNETWLCSTVPPAEWDRLKNSPATLQNTITVILIPVETEAQSFDSLTSTCEGFKKMEEQRHPEGHKSADTCWCFLKCVSFCSRKVFYF